MTKDEALAFDLALEALEYIHKGANNQGPHTGISWRCVSVKAEPAIKAIKQARALDKMAENARELGLDYAPVQEDWGPGPHECHSLTAAPVQEPVAFFDPQGKGFYWAKPTKITAPVTVDVEPLSLYTTPPAAQRQSARSAWVGLTDDEVSSLMRKFPDHLTWDITRAIEAKLKEKNT